MKGKKIPFGVNLMRSQVSHRAAQVFVAVIGRVLATALSLLTWSMNTISTWTDFQLNKQTNLPKEQQ